MNIFFSKYIKSNRLNIACLHINNFNNNNGNNKNNNNKQMSYDLFDQNIACLRINSHNRLGLLPLMPAKAKPDERK